MGYQSGTIPFEERTFSEEVVLLDGTRITASRAVVRGEETYTNIGYKTWVPVWRVTPPNGPAWEINGFNAVAIDRDAQSWIIVAVPEVGAPYRLHGCPIPPYVYYRNAGKEWHEVPSSNTPDHFALNLLVKFDPVNPKAGQYFSSEEKSNLREKLLDGEKKRWAAMPHLQSNGPRKLPWFSRLWYLGEFNKQCNPATQNCNVKDACW